MGEILLLKSSIQLGDIAVTLSLAEETATPVTDQAQVQRWLDDIIGLIGKQMVLGLESDLDKAILRAIQVSRRRC